ncbi:MAG TPA: adenylate/guanylate cyclase domain-containing protein [Thermoleophilaceae bacterium]|nr:adenylate/guanylate cyclase domain-containing protein [Thermoleophilaceae bacterium]
MVRGLPPDPPWWRRLPAWVDRLAEVGTLPSDSEDDRVRKSTLTLAAALMTALAVVWVVTYAVLGLWLSALIPFVYQVMSTGSIVLFARTKRYRLFRASQLCMMLILPFLLQWSLGGFETSSAVGLWGVTAPLGALMFYGIREALPWLAGFVALVVISGAIDSQLSTPEIPGAVVVTFFVLNVLGVSTTVYLLLQYFMRARERVLVKLARKHTALEAEQEKSERLLLNVLPAPIAERLKASPGVIADGFEGVTVLFADIVEFTPLADELPPEEVVALLDRVFSGFDELTQRHGLEKIKTIGDAYMVAGGLPIPRPDHAEAVAEMALAMREEVRRHSGEVPHPLDIRIGIDSGPVVAGVIGRRKFIYDLWGDTVNTASRMESHGVADGIQVTQRTYERLRERYDLRSRGEIEVKGKGAMTTYLLLGRTAKAEPPAQARSGTTAV